MFVIMLSVTYLDCGRNKWRRHDKTSKPLGKSQARKKSPAWGGILRVIDNMSIETWKPVVGYEGRYEVSSLGNIRNKHKKLLKTWLHRNGYVNIQLWKENKQTNLFVHRLVAKAFIPNPLNHLHVHHQNSVKTDNSVKNLLWCTPQQNWVQMWIRELTALGYQIKEPPLTRVGA